MSLEDDLRNLLEDDGPAPGPGVPEGRLAARVRILDAAVGVLAATGVLVAAAEDAVREERSRVVAGAAGQDRGAGRPDAPAGRRRIDLTY